MTVLLHDCHISLSQLNFDEIKKEPLMRLFMSWFRSRSDTLN